MHCTTTNFLRFAISREKLLKPVTCDFQNGCSEKFTTNYKTLATDVFLKEDCRHLTLLKRKSVTDVLDKFCKRFHERLPKAYLPRTFSRTNVLWYPTKYMSQKLFQNFRENTCEGVLFQQSWTLQFCRFIKKRDPSLESKNRIHNSHLVLVFLLLTLNM